MSNSSDVHEQTLEAALGREGFEVNGPDRGWGIGNIAELWQYRGLILMLGLRDIRVRYKQTIIGAVWALLRPLAIMLIWTVFFRLLGRVPAAGAVPYAITLFTALLPWQLFSAIVLGSSNSLVANETLLKKVYFPRLVFPVLPVLPAVVDFLLAMIVLVGMMIFYSVEPTWHVLALPFFVGVAGLAGIALGLWFSAANAMYRDVQQGVPFFLQVMFFLTPVVYETNVMISEQWRLLYALNPMVGVIEGCRWSLLGGDLALPMVLVSMASALVILLTGLVWFRRLERTFVDWI